MAERPTEKKETAKKDEEYQPLWDTDQSVPEYMSATTVRRQRAQKNEDAQLHENSDDIEEPGGHLRRYSRIPQGR